MKHYKIYFILLCFSLVQILNVQARTIPKAGFEQRIHDAVFAVRLIDTHEHIMSEKEALESAADFSCLFTNYQLSDLISAGALSEKIYKTFKGKDVSPEEKWSIIKDSWADVRTTAYGRSVLIGAKDLFGIDDLNENTYKELSKRIKEAHKSGYY